MLYDIFLILRHSIVCLTFLFHCDVDYLDLHSFPTRRSSDLPELLNLTEQDLLDPDADIEDLATEYPDTWVQGDITLPLAYSFGQLGAKGADGVTATVPLAVLNRLQIGRAHV